jgi:ABC-type transport system substrate-binding protein
MSHYDPADRRSDPVEAAKLDALVGQAISGRINRRQFIGRLTAMGLAPAAIASVLAACGGSDDSAGGGAEAASDTQTTAAATGAAESGDESQVPGFPWQGGTRGGDVTLSVADATITQDPPITFGNIYYALPLFYRGLVYRGGSLDNPEVQPDLAESIDIDPSGTKYNFKLRKGVQFHHGREVVASDFKYSIERGITSDGQWAGGYLAAIKGYQEFVDGSGDLAGVQTNGDYELTIELDTPDVTIGSALALPPHFVYPQEEVERLGDQWNFSPIGTGPYKLDNLDETGASLTMSRFDGYVWGDSLPYIDSQEWRWNVAPELAFLQVQRGQLQGSLDNLPAAAVSELRGSDEFKDQFAEWNAFYLNFFELNVTKPPFDDIRVRQAVNHAVNPDRWNGLLINATGHIFPPDLLGFDENAETYGYDPERAKALLTEAGYSAGDLSITIPILNAGQAGAGKREQFLQQDLQEIGIKVDLRREQGDLGDLGPTLIDNEALWLVQWGMGLPDPAEIYVSLAGTDAPYNFGGVENPEGDKLAQQGVGETDQAKRAELYAAYEKSLIDNASLLFIGVSTWGTFRAPEVQNFYWEPALYQHWDRYWLEG